MIKINWDLKNYRRKMAVTVLTAILLLGMYSLIFAFSAQDGDESGGLSRAIIRACVEFVNSLKSKAWTLVEMNYWTEYFVYPVRKLAHFCEYACMGLLIYTLLRQWKERTGKFMLMSICWVFLSAASDEFHQYFVPGRCASLADVLLDTCGGIAGMIFCILVEKLFPRKKKNAKSN